MSLVSNPGGGVKDHGELVGLLDDDHSIYAHLTGRSGGQTLIGGTGSGDDLILQSTSHATRGQILIGTDDDDQVVIGDTGTTSASSNLIVANNKTYSSGGNVTSNFMRTTPTVDTTTGLNLTGTDMTTTMNNSVAATQLIGVAFQAASTGSGGLTRAIGVNAFATSWGSGGVTDATGARIGMGSLTGTATNQYGIDFSFQGFFGAVTNAAGIRINPAVHPATNETSILVGASIPTGDWAVHVSSTRDNAFAGATTMGATTAPTTSAVLDLSSTTGALLVTRMTTTQRNALTASNGMVLYNTTTNEFNFRENGAWVTGSGLA